MGVLAGKACLVTGGSRGIGRAIALELGRQGALVNNAGITRDRSLAKMSSEEWVSRARWQERICWARRAGKEGDDEQGRSARRGSPMTTTPWRDWLAGESLWSSNDRALETARAVLGSADAPVGLTPKELVWRKNKARLYRYLRPEPAARHRDRPGEVNQRAAFRRRSSGWAASCGWRTEEQGRQDGWCDRARAGDAPPPR